MKHKRNLAEFRERILALDRYDCRNPRCPKTGITILSSHHIKYRSQGGDESSNNGITLCSTCDQYAHGQGNLKNENGQRVSGDEFTLKILEYWKNKNGDRWKTARKHLKLKIQKKS